ncbi:MAG: lasso peptide biosynthesis B2 protein [Acidimicrobiales bacterium]
MRALCLARRPALVVDIAEAVLLLGAAEACLRYARLGTIARWFGAALEFTDSPTGWDPSTLGLSRSERRKLRVLARVARRWPLSPQGACLRHSLAASHMLRGHRPRLRLGVAGGALEEMRAHAWLEVNGTAITHPGDYVPLLRRRAGGPGPMGTPELVAEE